MKPAWKESIYLQREQLGQLLREPLSQLAQLCVAVWGDRERLDTLLTDHFAEVPHCACLYCMDINGVQICDDVTVTGLERDQFGFDRSHRPYMQEEIPSWGFLLSDAYISLKQRPSLTALQVVRDGTNVLGYLGADFDLRDLPVTAALYKESDDWLQLKGDPSIRGAVFQQRRIESPMDRILERSLSILEELITQSGVFQCLIHFSSSQVTIWMVDDPFRYRLLSQDALSDPDICLVYPARDYPADAAIPATDITKILEILRALRMADENIYLRIASINIFNGMVSLTFSCDGTHYMRYDELLSKDISFWFGTAM